MNVRVDLSTPIYDGMEVKFRAPCDAADVTGLKLYYQKDGVQKVQNFAFADASANNVGHIGALFAKGAVVKVILDLETNMAFILNADTNSYLEQRFNDLGEAGGSIELDTTLSVSGKAADAKAVGDKIEEVSEAAVIAVNESLAKKLDKVTTTGSTLFYGVNAYGEQIVYSGAIKLVASSIAMRGVDGTLNVGTPTLDTHAATKKYVDDNAIEVYRASYDVYTNELNGNFADLKNAFDSGKIVMLTCDTPVGNVWSFCCDGYETANYGTISEECLVFHSCSTESIRTIYVCADGTIQEKFVNIGDIDAALERIIEIQNSLIGGE